MFGCPRCGNDAVYLADEAFSLIRCEFCGDATTPMCCCRTSTISVAGCCPAPGRELLPPLEAEFV